MKVIIYGALIDEIIFLVYLQELSVSLFLVIPFQLVELWDH